MKTKVVKGEKDKKTLLTIQVTEEEKKVVKKLTVDLNIGMRDILFAGLKTLTSVNAKK